MIHPEKESIYERAKHGYAKCLEDGFKANPTLKTKFQLYPGENSLNQGWALKSCKSRSPFSKRQKEFWMKFFERVSGLGSKQILTQFQRP